MENLKRAVLTVERFTGRHVTLPILSHIHFVTDGKVISVRGTNLEVGIDHVLTGKAQQSGSVTAPAKQLTQLVSSLTDGVVMVEGKGNELAIETPSSRTTLIGLDPKEFPTIPTITHEYSFTIPGAWFIAALRQVAPAMATSDMKPELAGVFLVAHPGTITLAATDSFRLTEKTLSNLEGVRVGTSCIIPLRTVQELIRTIPEDHELAVGIGERQITFEWEGSRIISRLVDGTFPSYLNIIPNSYQASLEVDREDFLNTIRLASVFSSRLNDVTITFSPSEIEVATINPESGGTTSRLAAKGRGNPGSAVFNHRYLSDGVEAAGGEQVQINLNGVSGPTLVQNPTDASYRYLVMPIRSV